MRQKTDLRKRVSLAQKAYQAGAFAEAAGHFSQAAAAYAAEGDELNAAEMSNNQSVALLNHGQPQAALEAARGTDLVFARLGDRHRQGMALANQAAALEALDRLDEAIEIYERSAALLEEAGAGDTHAYVMKALAAIRLRRGKVSESAMDMLSYLNALEKPNFLQRLLKTILRLP
jgi:tetratricopeptide (TPR) repeat protein